MCLYYGYTCDGSLWTGQHLYREQTLPTKVIKVGNCGLVVIHKMEGFLSLFPWTKDTMPFCFLSKNIYFIWTEVAMQGSWERTLKHHEKKKGRRLVVL